VKVRLVDRLVYWCARLAIAVMARVPQWLGYGFAALLGRLFFRLDRRRRGYALHLLKNAFPERSERELLRIGARATANLFKVPLDMARLTRLLARGGDLDRVVGGSEDLERLAGTKPLFGLTGHLGNWEVSAAAMAQHLGGAYVVARVSKNPLLQRWILRNRERCGLHILPRRGGIKDLAAAMARGAVGLQAVDQNQRLRGVFAPFFGEIASCERAAVSLALRRGYPLTVGCCLRTGSGFRFRFECCEPFVLKQTGDKRQDLYNAAVTVNQHLEALIRRAPEQYLWIHDRYRTKAPPGAEAVAAGDEAADDGTD
jgi:KDO2-lipid IV(A) lauroyltransferase